MDSWKYATVNIFIEHKEHSYEKQDEKVIFDITKYPSRTEVRIIIMCMFVMVSFVSIGCSDETVKSVQTSKGDRILAIQANMGKEGDFDSLFLEALDAGIETQVISQDWKDLETSPGAFKSKVNFLAIANAYYPTRNIPIHLTIRPIHTSQKVVPTDLMDMPLDDPQTIKRFMELLDWIAMQIPKIELTSLTIGSEIDIFMWGDAEEWKTWTNFYAAVAPYARHTFPGTLISCETTYAAFIGPDLPRVRALHAQSDIIGVSYYPMQEQLGGVKPPQDVHGDFETVVNAIPGKPIIYYQIGYPSSTNIGSSLARQATFISEAFRAWDTYTDRILMLNFQWMHETPNFGIDQYVEYYQYDTPDFRAFLGSLGLQSWEGSPKPAWETLKKEARVRGFGL